MQRPFGPVGVWQQLPWVLAGLGHWDLDVCRRLAVDVIQLFDQSSQVQEQHHRVTWEWLSVGSTIRAALQAFADGAPMSRQLREAIANLIFIVVVERQQEGAHSIIKRGTQFRKVGGPFVSLQLRGVQLMQFFDKHRDKLMDMFSKMCDPKKVCSWFGLSRHPLYKAAVHNAL